MKNKDALKISLLAILFGVLLGVVILLLTGRDPFYLFYGLVRGASGLDLIKGGSINPRYTGDFLVASMPIILTGLSVAFAFRTGLFYIVA